MVACVRVRPWANCLMSVCAAFGLCCGKASGLPRAEALRTGAARYESEPLNVSAADEASVYTPAGFSKPGKPMVASGADVGRLKLIVRDKATGKPTCCRVNVVGPDGNYYEPKENHLAAYSLTRGWMERAGGLPRGNRPGVPPIRYYGNFFYCSGDVTIKVPAGAVRVEAWKGFEYRPAVVATQIASDETRTVELTLEQTAPMRPHGYYAGDPHLHFSREEPADDELIFDLMEANGIHFGSILAYNDPPGPYSGVMQELATPQLHGMGRSSIRRLGDYHIMSGQEYRSTTFGHLNFYMNDGLVLPAQQTNADDWPLYGDLGAEVQKAGGYAFYAHGGYAQSVYADLAQGNVNGVELLQFAVYRGIGLADWYHVLNSGFRFPILGSSDYPWCRVLGDCKTYVHAEGEVDFANWLEGAAKGRSFVTSGPMLLLEVDDGSEVPAKAGAEVCKSGPGPHRLTARIRVRSEVAPVTHVQLIVNGEVVEEKTTPEDQGTSRWLDLEGTIVVDRSSWIAARAFSKTASGAANAESHTNPVYVYLDGRAPYQQKSLDEMVDRIDRQIEFHKQRDFERKAEVLDYFERSRDILLTIRAAGGARSEGHPADVATDVKALSTNDAGNELPEENFKEFLKPIPAKTPAEALKTFETANGFEMQLVAQEPLVCDPIAAEFDENGQLYVCEMRDYPYQPKPGDKPLGAVRLLRDVDGDGIFDESHLFADGLLWPSGVVPWQGGVFVAAAPDIWYLKDTDGDHRADVRKNVFTGFGTQNQQAMLNNLKFGPDHMIYGATAGNGGTVRAADDPKAKGVAVTGRDFRFDPRSLQFETVTGTIQFGNSFDDWGNRFVCSEARPLMHVVLPQNYLARNPYLSVPSAIHNLAPGSVPVFRISPTERWRQIRSNRRVAFNHDAATHSGVSHHVVDAAAGVTIYRGAAYPAEYYGNAFVGDAQNNLIHRRTLDPDGVTFQSKRADEHTEFARSSDNWFRPVNFVNAPDGTLYVLDMSREIIESVHIPSDIAKHLDLTNGRDQGRIYRMAPSGFHSPPPPRLGAATAAELVASLENPNGWWRDTAHRLIYERQDRSCAPALRNLLNTSETPQARLLALWSLHGLEELSDSDLEQALSDSSPNVREQAIHLSESRLDSSERLREKVLEKIDDLSPRVCFQLAFTLGEINDERAIPALAHIAQRHRDDAWIRTAVLSSSSETADRTFRELIRDESFASSNEGVELLSQLAQIVGVRNHTDEVERLILSLAEDTSEIANSNFHDAAVLGLGGGLIQSGGRLPSPSVLPSIAASFLRSLVERAEATALNVDAEETARQQAIELLGCLEFEVARPTLTNLLDPLEPQSIQLAALNSLANYDNSKIAATILDNWLGYRPEVRARAIRLLLSRDEWTEAYLVGIQDGRATVAEIDAAGRTQLLRHRQEAIRVQAEKLFAESPRAAVIVDYRSVLLQPGDPSRGEQVFKRECSACHQLNGVGHQVGPDLASSASSDAEALLANILDPNRYVAPTYMQYLALTDSGRASVGMISAETATSISLARGEGVVETILRTTIEELASTGQSLMPEGFEKKISKAEMADLIAYLGGVKGKADGVAKPLDVGTVPGQIEP